MGVCLSSLHNYIHSISKFDHFHEWHFETQRYFKWQTLMNKTLFELSSAWHSKISDAHWCILNIETKMKRAMLQIFYIHTFKDTYYCILYVVQMTISKNLCLIRCTVCGRSEWYSNEWSHMVYQIFLLIWEKSALYREKFAHKTFCALEWQMKIQKFFQPTLFSFIKTQNSFGY